jgi:hypothetical protein
MSLLEVGTTHEPTIGSKGHGLFGIPGAQLPAVIQHLFNDLVESGKHKPDGRTYALSVGIVKNWSRGEGAKDPKVIAQAQAAIKEWDRLKSEAHARTAAKDLKGAAKKDDKKVKEGDALILEVSRLTNPFLVAEGLSEEALALAGELGEAAAQPRYKTGKFTNVTRGVSKKTRNHGDLMGDVKSAHHSGDRVPAYGARGFSVVVLPPVVASGMPAPMPTPTPTPPAPFPGPAPAMAPVMAGLVYEGVAMCKGCEHPLAAHGKDGKCADCAKAKMKEALALGSTPAYTPGVEIEELKAAMYPVREVWSEAARTAAAASHKGGGHSVGDTVGHHHGNTGKLLRRVRITAIDHPDATVVGLNGPMKGSSYSVPLAHLKRGVTGTTVKGKS